LAKNVEHERDAFRQVIESVFCGHVLHDSEFDIGDGLIWQYGFDFTNLRIISYSSTNSVPRFEC